MRYEIAKKNSGSALLYVLLILSIFIVIAGLVLSSQLKQFRFALNESDAIVAFYAADVGIESTLYYIFVDQSGTLPQDNCAKTGDPCTGAPSGGADSEFMKDGVFLENPDALDAEYTILVPRGELDSASSTIIRSIGTVKGRSIDKNRAIEITILEG